VLCRPHLPEAHGVGQGQLPPEEHEEHAERKHEGVGPEVGEVLEKGGIENGHDAAEGLELPHDAQGALHQKIPALPRRRTGREHKKMRYEKQLEKN